MPLYMAQAAYTPEHLASLTGQPDDRTADVRELAQELGCRLVSFHYSFGEYDGLIILEAPDEKTAAASVLAAVSTGSLRAIKTTNLLTVEDTMEALRRAGEVTFRGPGQ